MPIGGQNMKPFQWTLAAVIASGLAPAALATSPAKTTTAETCKHGTAIQFAATPSLAAARAKAEQKLVFVLHVSGHFEDPTFT